jgi:arabinofuranan 3-O-arabinosyltransferase
VQEPAAASDVRRALLGGLAWVFAAGCALAVLALSLRHAHAGMDLRPIYNAGAAVRHGHPIYDVKNFVYPPTAALAAVPLTLVPFHVASAVYVTTEVVIVAALGAVTASWFLPRRWWPVAAGVLLVSNVALHSLWLENASVLLAAAALLVTWLFGRDHWLAGCVVLVLSLLLKPLLLPVIVIPLLARRVRPLLLAAAGGALVLLVSLPLTPGLGRLPTVARKILGGSVLIGQAAANNLSIRGFAQVHGLPTAVSTAARILVALVAIVVCALQVRAHARLDVPRTASLVALVMLATFLAGTLSEVHYLFVAIPGGCAAAVVSRRIAVRVASVVGLGASLVPLRHVQPSGHQAVLILSELAFFVAVALALSDVPRPLSAR